MKNFARAIGRAGLPALAALASLSSGCTVDEAPAGLRRTPNGTGPVVRFDPFHKPLPEIPLPNDSAMWPDPTSRTGLRINASLVAATDIEASARRKFDDLEGWGTYAQLSVAFDKASSNEKPALDLGNVARRHQNDDYELADDVVYLVDLETGTPVPLDLGGGAFQYVVREKTRYFRNDTRIDEQNLFWDTADETVDPATGEPDPSRTVYEPRFDTDFDGVLDRPNLLNNRCMNQATLAARRATAVDDAERLELELDRDTCIADELLSWYERETDTLLMRPLIPLEERRQYAIVVTDRAVDPDGRPVRSPFDFVYHPAQEDAMQRLSTFLGDASKKSYFGDIGGTGFSHVAFAWSFTTQPTIEDLRVIRDGLYGVGPLSRLSSEFAPDAEMARAMGLATTNQDRIVPPEAPDWKDQAVCRESWNKFHIMQMSKVGPSIGVVVGQALGSGPSSDYVVDALGDLSHVAIGSYGSPFFISGGPKGVDPNASFAMDFRTGEGEVTADRVQFFIAVPKETAEHKQPFPVAYYGHGYTSSAYELLGFAGDLARQGIASVGINATFHEAVLPVNDEATAEGLFAGGCAAPFARALFDGRARDLDADGIGDSGGDYWTSYMFHTRDVVRQSAVDLLQLFRVLKSFDGKRRTTQDFDLAAAGEQNIAGDFDADGVPDVGGPNVAYFAWGQSLGGILAPFAAALDPDVIASAPGSGAAGLLDVGARTFQGGAFEGIYLRNFGPLVVGVPATSLAADQTVCENREGVVSLRFVVVDVNDDREVELGCLDVPAVNGGVPLERGATVVVANRANGKTRCARMTPDGIFRIGIPSSVGDALEIAVWDEPDAVDSYDGDIGCNVTLDLEHRIALVDRWGNGPIARGAEDPLDKNGTVCEEADSCTPFQSRYYPVGSPLVAIAEGFGFIRQTPALRRLMGLAGHIIDPGDPINFAPYYSLRTITDPFGKPHPPKGMLNVVTIGDMNVPLNAGIAMGRAAGAVPFLRPDALERYPALADYVTPDELFSALGDKTPNRVLVENHVLEGINRLRRHPPASCGRNQGPLTTTVDVCHAECTDPSPCLDGQICDAGRCVASLVPEDECTQSLVDVDVLDEGSALYGEKEIGVALRLGRIATPVGSGSVEDVWEPRLAGRPSAADANGWSADRRVVAQLMAYTNPRGEHGFSPNDPCENFQTGRYMINLIGRFFATGGADLYYLSHPSSHRCLGRPPGAGGCPFVVDLGGR